MLDHGKSKSMNLVWSRFSLAWFRLLIRLLFGL